MDKKDMLFKVISFAGLLLGGIGTLLSSWADNERQEVIIEEKVENIYRSRHPNEIE